MTSKQQSEGGGSALSRAMKKFIPEPRLLFMVFSSTVIAYLPLFVLPWLITSFVTGRGMSDVEAGAIGAAMSLSLAGTTLLFGSLVSHLPPKESCLAAAFIALLALALLVLRPGDKLMLGALIVFAAACGACGAIGASLLSASQNPTRMTGSLWALLAVSQGVIWTITPRTAAHFGETGVFFAATAFLLLVFPFLLIAPKNARASGESDIAAKNSAPARARLLVICAVLLMVVSFWLRDGVIWSLADRRAADLGVMPDDLSLSLLGASMFGFMGAVTATRLENRFPLRANLLTGLALVAAIMLTIAGAHAKTVYLGAFVFWAGSSIFAWTFILGISARLDATGRLPAIASGLSFAAGAFGPLLGGFLLQEREGALLFPAVLVLTIVTFIGACVIPGRSKPPTQN